MPNGFHGSRHDWDRLSAALVAADDRIARFAGSHGATVRRDERSWPSRSIEWGDPIRRVIWISLVDEKRETWDLGVFATFDRGRKRYLRRAHVRQAAPWQEIGGQLESLLAEGHRLAESWRAEDIPFAVDIPA